MLGFMRKKAGSWLIKVIFGAIVIVFVFWGVGSFRDKKVTQVAAVNGESIERDEYRRTYNNYIENLRRQFRDNLTPEVIKMLQVKQQVINGLINQKLLLQEAIKLNLRVSNEELIETIQALKAFHTAGSFDRRRFLSIMDRLRMAPEVFEEEQRQEILVNKVRAMVIGGIQVPDGEVKEWYKYNNTAVNIDFVLFSPNNYKDIEPDEDALKAYFDEHTEAYKTAPEVNARYLRFVSEDYTKKVTVQEEDIANYYDYYQDEFKSEKTVSARHILIKVDPGASEEAVEAAKEKLIGVLKEAKSGKDFETLAKKYSEGPSKDQGGDLGTFTKDTMVKPFADKAFSMAAGEISDPVRTQFGWHLIKVEKVTAAGVRSLAEATKEINEKLTKKMALEMAFEAAETAYDAAFVDGDLEKTATALKLDLKTTGFFNKKGEKLDFSTPAKFAEAAFDLEDNEVSNILEFDNGYYILQRIETNPERIPTLEAVKDRVRLDVIKSQQQNKVTADAKAFLAALKDGADMAAEAKKYGLKVSTTGFFKRNEMIPKIGNEQGITRAAFALSNDEKLSASVLEGRNGQYVISFKARQAPTMDGFVVEKEKIKKTIRQQKEREFFSRWLEMTRSKSDIIIADAFRN